MKNRTTRTVAAMVASVLACAVLAACGKAPAADAAPAETAAPTVTEAPAVTETPAAAEPVTVAGIDPAEYTFAEQTATLADGSAIPAVTIPVYYGAQEEGGWEAVAAATGMTVEELQALNPDVQVADDGSVTTYGLLLAEAADLQEWAQPNQTLVSWPQAYMGQSYAVPADLDDQAKATMAEGLDFLYQHDMSRGYWPAEPVNGDESVYHSIEGARFTTFTELQQYMEDVFTPDLIAGFVCTEPNSWGYLDGYRQGDNDSIEFTPGDRGANIMYLGTVYTDKLAPAETEGVALGMLSLECAPDADPGSDVGAAYYAPVRLVSTDAGCRVAALSLPN